MLIDIIFFRCIWACANYMIFDVATKITLTTRWTLIEENTHWWADERISITENIPHVNLQNAKMIGCRLVLQLIEVPGHMCLRTHQFPHSPLTLPCTVGYAIIIINCMTLIHFWWQTNWTNINMLEQIAVEKWVSVRKSINLMSFSVVVGLHVESSNEKCCCWFYRR